MSTSSAATARPSSSVTAARSSHAPDTVAVGAIKQLMQDQIFLQFLSIKYLKGERKNKIREMERSRRRRSKHNTRTSSTYLRRRRESGRTAQPQAGALVTAASGAADINSSSGGRLWMEEKRSIKGARAPTMAVASSKVYMSDGSSSKFG